MANKFFILTLSVVLVFFSCNNEEEGPTPIDISSNNSKNKIMPLGASRVEGARPEYESYRYQLWKQLLDGGWEFDFIGTMKDPATYPNYSNQNFDADHEGRGGWTSGQILEEIRDWIRLAGAPDIVLFSSPGGNDALNNASYEQAISNINAIIDIIQAANPGATIIVEQLAPARSDQMTPTLTNFFNRMQKDVMTIADEQTTPSSKVLTVDMSTGFKDSFLADDVHYNELGANFIANRYYEVLVDVME